MPKSQKKPNIGDCQAAVDALRLLKYFPGDQGTQAALVEWFARRVQTVDALQFIVRTVQDSGIEEWPGLGRLGEILDRYRGAEQAASLPAPCIECASYYGKWRLVRRGDQAGLERCSCSRGRILAERDQERRKIAPPPDRPELQPATEIMRRVAGDVE